MLSKTPLDGKYFSRSLTGVSGYTESVIKILGIELFSELYFIHHLYPSEWGDVWLPAHKLDQWTEISEEEALIRIL